MDRLATMRSFVTAARAGSVTGAARELSISSSLVSRHIADLEHHLGLRLLHRTSHAITLTSAGEEYRRFSQRILEEIEHEHTTLARARDEPEGELSILSPKWIGTLEMGEPIAAFATAYPKIRLRIELGSMSDRAYDFVDRGFDIALHARDLKDSNLLLRRLADLPFVLTASRDYLDRRGRPRVVNELAAHACLVHANDAVWRLGSGSDTVQHRVAVAAASTNSYILLASLVRAGSGIALIPQRAVLEDLRSGALEVVLPLLPPPSRTLFALRAPGAEPERTRVFLDFLGEWFRAQRQPHGTDIGKPRPGPDTPAPTDRESVLRTAR